MSLPWSFEKWCRVDPPLKAVRRGRRTNTRCGSTLPPGPVTKVLGRRTSPTAHRRRRTQPCGSRANWCRWIAGVRASRCPRIRCRARRTRGCRTANTARPHRSVRCLPQTRSQGLLKHAFEIARARLDIEVRSPQPILGQQPVRSSAPTTLIGRVCTQTALAHDEHKASTHFALIRAR